MKLRSLLLALPLLFLPTWASAKPFWKSKGWWLSEVGSAGLVFIDARSTQRALQRCPGCGDAFPFFTVHGPASIAGGALFDFGLSTGFHVAEYHEANKSSFLAVRTAGSYMQLGIDAAEHGWAISTNLHIQCTQAGINCN